MDWGGGEVCVRISGMHKGGTQHTVMPVDQVDKFALAEYLAVN